MRTKRVNFDRPPCSLELERETLLRLCEAFPSPRSIAIHSLITARDYAGYLSLEWDPKHYTEAECDLFRTDYLLTKFLSKSQVLPLGIDREEVARQKFLDAEKQCFETNSQLESRISSSDEVTRNILHNARAFIYRVLGPLTASTWDKIRSGFGYGPGATLSVKGCDVSMDAKYGNRRITSTLATTNFFLFSDDGLRHVYNGSELEIVKGGKLSFVPKEAKTDRAIVTEPDLNIFYQKGFGSYIRSRLKLFGCDLDDSTWNQYLASVAFIEGLATVDLASASDTISIRTVEFLLPQTWLRLLATFRSPNVLLPDGSYIELEKWSSMGNGYTFELESLIFFAIARAVVEVEGGDLTRIGVFGDDIIVPASSFTRLSHMLKLLGFTMNEAKSFGEGCFFESCGSDFFCGHNARPIFARRKEYGQRTWYYERSFYIYQIANRLRSWSGRGSHSGICDPRARNVYDWLISQLPEEHLNHVPVGFDGGIHSELDEAQHGISFSRKRRCWVIRELTPDTRRRAGRDKPLYYASLNGQYSADDDKSRISYGHIEATRSMVGWSSKNRSVPYWGWTGPGPWA